MQALELTPGNAKALFRRGVANMNLNNFESAEADLCEAETIDPKGILLVQLYSTLFVAVYVFTVSLWSTSIQDTAIKKQLQELQQRRQHYERTEQKMYSAMLQTS